MKKVYEAVIPPGGWSDRFTYSPAVLVSFRAGNLLYISGMTSADEKDNLIGAGDIVRQAEYIFEKMGRILAAAGADFSNVVETTDYYLTLEGYAQTAAVRKKVFGGPPYPAATGVQVAGLIRPGALIEIKAVAVLGEAHA
jgi:enamine deaminase RidA (YjgF/YER057c/UK114 family)